MLKFLQTKMFHELTSTLFANSFFTLPHGCKWENKIVEHSVRSSQQNMNFPLKMHLHHPQTPYSTHRISVRRIMQRIQMTHGHQIINSYYLLQILTSFSIPFFFLSWDTWTCNRKKTGSTKQIEKNDAKSDLTSLCSFFCFLGGTLLLNSFFFPFVGFLFSIAK